MKTAPISISLIDSAGSDLSVVNAARVSFHKESEWEIIGYEEVYNENDDLLSQYPVKALSQKDQKLIKYLATHNHWSPFAHTFLSFRVKAPIFLARQLVKHSVGGMWNEVSRRYVDEEPEFYFPTSWRGRAENAKQGSSETIIPKHEVDNAMEWYGYDGTWYSVTECALKSYQSMLAVGVAPEQARMILPQNTMTDWIWSGSLAFFARVYKERSNPGAQKEAQEFAEILNKLIPEEYQHSWHALTN